MRGRPILLYLLVCVFYVLHWDIISQTNFKITKVFFLLRYFNKTRVSVLFLRFPYFELRNIYRRFRISPISIYVVRFSHIVFNIGNKRFITMRCITNCLRVSSAGWQIAYMVKQLNIANSWNNSVIATKYIEYSTRYPFYHGACWCIMNRRIVYSCTSAC